VLGARIGADQALHSLHGVFGPAELVVGPRLLVEDLVAVLVARVLAEQPVIEGDRLEWTRGIYGRASRARRRVAATEYPELRGRALLEFLVRFPHAGAGDRGRIGRVRLRAQRCRSWLRGGHFPWLAVARAQTELLLDLQVRETPHGLRSHRRFRCLLEEALVALHGLIEALLDRRLLHVRAHVAQLRQRPRRFLGMLGAADDERRGEHHRNGEAAHQRTSASDWARAARS
jgi:hypothetical protein